ncbi:reverse transcriptase domain-containing protein [Tanacetum coccineum]
MHEEERLLMDTESEKGIQRHEAMYSSTTNGNRIKTQRRANNVPLCNQRSDQCSLTSEKRLTANASLLCQPRPANSLSELQSNGETGFSIGTCHKEAEEAGQGRPPTKTTEEVTSELWTLFTDRSSCIEGSGAGFILTSPEGEEFTYALRFKFDASNNEAEYEALVAGL